MASAVSNPSELPPASGGMFPPAQAAPSSSEPLTPVPATAEQVDPVVAVQALLQNPAVSPHNKAEQLWQLREGLLRRVYRLTIEE